MGDIDRSQKQWEETTLKDWVEKYGERRESFSAFNGTIPIKAAYTPLDLQEKGVDYLRDIGFPGEYPYTRGNEPNMYRRQFWEMSQYAGFGSAEDTNKRLKDLLGRGLTGVFIALDLPTQVGYDSDHPMARKEVGKVGVAVDSLEDMERMFEGIPLDSLSSIHTTANSMAPVWIALLLALCEKQGVDPNNVHGGTQNDVLREFAGRGTQIFPVRPSLKFTTDVGEFCARNLPGWAPYQISGEHMVGMGARTIEGMAFALADGIQYVTSVLERGVDIDAIAPLNEFLVSSRGDDFLGDIAKFRAMRRMWARIMKERFGAKNPESMKMKIIAFGSGSFLTRQEPLNNIIRITIQCLALALGGVSSLNLPSYDEGLSTPAADAARMALRTQQIVAHETGIADSADPLGGSYYLENITSELESQCMDIIHKIDALGGAAAAIEKGFYERLVNRGAYEYHKELEKGERIKVGVNKFQDETVKMPGETFRGSNMEVEEKQCSRLRDLKERRDNRAVARCLKALEVSAKKGDNLVLPIFEAVKVYTTVGEVCDTLRNVWGEWHAHPSLEM